jgi:hypothetical protein
MQRFSFGLVLLVAAACSSATSVPSPSVSSVPSPSVGASVTPAPSDVVTKPCPSLLECMETAKAQQLANAPTLVFHYSDSVNIKSQRALEAIASEYLPIYAGFFAGVSPGTTIHVFLSLDPAWCGKQLVKYEYGTAAELEKSPVCVQDGGANAGRSRDQRRTAHVVLRPHPTEVVGAEKGNSTSLMLRNIFIAELGHASRALRYDATATESGPDRGAPIWLQYVSNEAASFFVGISDGESKKAQDAYSTWWGQPKKLTWRPTYTDRRLISWQTGGGIFATESGDRIVPNHYNLAYMAARYLVPKFGLYAVQDKLIGTIFVTKGDLDAGAVALGYTNWATLITELDGAIYAAYEAEGITVPAE